MLNCREYASSVSSGELERAGIGIRLAAAYHWLICKYCRAYTRQQRALGAAARRLFRREPADLESLAELERRLVERCRSAGRSSDRGSSPLG